MRCLISLSLPSYLRNRAFSPIKVAVVGKVTVKHVTFHNLRLKDFNGCFCRTPYSLNFHPGRYIPVQCNGAKAECHREYYGGGKSTSLIGAHSWPRATNPSYDGSRRRSTSPGASSLVAMNCGHRIGLIFSLQRSHRRRTNPPQHSSATIDPNPDSGFIDCDVRH